MRDHRHAGALLQHLERVSNRDERIRLLSARWVTCRDDPTYLSAFVTLADELIAARQPAAARETLEYLRERNPLFFADPRHFSPRIRDLLWPAPDPIAAPFPAPAPHPAMPRISAADAPTLFFDAASLPVPSPPAAVPAREKVMLVEARTYIFDRPRAPVSPPPARIANARDATVCIQSPGEATVHPKPKPAEMATVIRAAPDNHATEDRIDDWIPEALLGEGASGRVYRARHRLIPEMHAAIKVLSGPLARDPAAAGRFLREARAAWRVNHDNVVRIHGAGRTSGRLPYIAMELLDGSPLTAMMVRDGRRIALRGERVAHIGLGVARGVAAAHAAGVIHRDLKPDNVMVIPRPGRGDLIKVLDFGIARLLDATGETLTAQHLRIGTPAYMSPEQCRGDAVDGRSDIYSLGALLFECLTGQAFAPSDPWECLKFHLTRGPLSFPRGLRVAAPFQRLVRRMTEPEPAARIGSMVDVVHKLEGLLDVDEASG